MPTDSISSILEQQTDVLARITPVDREALLALGTEQDFR